MVEINFIIGLIGMFLILVSFIMEEFWKKFNPNTYKFNLLNILGSGMLIIYAYGLRGWPFLILNSVWLVAAVIKTLELWERRR
ncbi:MAG: hypothetical protein WCV90_00600 [Candidatus Woesearchaeota archaeon]|jgi:hypothetical protein